jgi:hypothetical protein
MKKWLYMFVLGLIPGAAAAQLQVQLNATADLELMKGGANSHYYINGIHKDLKDWTVLPLELNLAGRVDFSPQWAVNLRLQVERDEGKSFNTFRLAQANVQWTLRESPFQFTLGRFITPFGLFPGNQMSINRLFVDVPLAYGYFVNVSDQIGWVEGLGEASTILIGGRNEWGLPVLYYNGYSNGLHGRWAIRHDKAVWDLALVTSAPNRVWNLKTDPLNFGVVSRLHLQPTYFWKQGISLSHGSFFQRHPLNGALTDPNRYRQTLAGLDFILGFGHFEFSGELIAAFYRTPAYDKTNQRFVESAPGQLLELNLNNLSAYVDAKYEFPFLVGTYVAYRVEALMCCAIPSASAERSAASRCCDHRTPCSRSRTGRMRISRPGERR